MTRAPAIARTLLKPAGTLVLAMLTTAATASATAAQDSAAAQNSNASQKPDAVKTDAAQTPAAKPARPAEGSENVPIDPVKVEAAAKAAAEKEARHISGLRQVTSGLPRAGEGYFSADGKNIVYQAYPVGYPFYQIYSQPLENGTPLRLSPGRGRTTCSYFTKDGQRVLFASSHTDPNIEQTEKAARELAAQGGRRRYQWDFDPHMDLYTVAADGTGLARLTDSPGYDAEGSYSPDGKHIVFTSSRDGDPDLFVMDADGKNVRQLTNVPGYDGGPFFSPDGQWVIFRSDRQKEHMLQLFAISADGQTEVQLTDNLEQVNWCPFFHPSGKYLVWSGADYSQGPRGAFFHLFTMEIESDARSLKGGTVTQITHGDFQDVLPVFSPDGAKLMWTSTRSADKSSQLWLADWLRAAR